MVLLLLHKQREQVMLQGFCVVCRMCNITAIEEGIRRIMHAHNDPFIYENVGICMEINHLCT